MGQDQTARAETGADQPSGIAERLDAIEEQGRVTNELLRTLLGLLTPNEDRDGPSLEDLVAAMIAMQRDLLAIARGTRSDIKRLGETLPSAVAEALGTDGATRVLRS